MFDDYEDTIQSCSFCGSTNDVSFEPDPFSSDVCGDDTPVWICRKCYKEHADDI